MSWFTLLVIIVAVISGQTIFAQSIQRRADMREALDRGYAERCVGISAIHWKGECPETPAEVGK